jgi:hypothetical protein
VPSKRRPAAAGAGRGGPCSPGLAAAPSAGAPRSAAPCTGSAAAGSSSHAPSPSPTETSCAAGESQRPNESLALCSDQSQKTKKERT